MKDYGIFYGVGVGPGDPDLMTVMAVNALKAADVIAVPRSSDFSSDGLSQAMLIARRAVDLEGKILMELRFPMTMDAVALNDARREAAARIVAELEQGRSVVFITLGDPMLYSTFSYLVPFVRELAPKATVKSVPGISSFCAAASTVLSPLVEAGEKLLVVPAVYDVDELRELLESSETVVLMKVNRKFDRIVDLLVEMGQDNNAVLVTRAGWPEEKVTTDIKSLKGASIDYFSTLIVKKGI